MIIIKKKIINNLEREKKTIIQLFLNLFTISIRQLWVGGGLVGRGEAPVGSAIMS